MSRVVVMCECSARECKSLHTRPEADSTLLALFPLQVWQGIDAKTAPYRQKLPAIVNQGLGYMQAWFLKVQ